MWAWDIRDIGYNQEHRIGGFQAKSGFDSVECRIWKTMLHWFAIITTQFVFIFLPRMNLHSTMDDLLISLLYFYCASLIFIAKAKVDGSATHPAIGVPFLLDYSSINGWNIVYTLFSWGSNWLIKRNLQKVCSTEFSVVLSWKGLGTSHEEIF